MNEYIDQINVEVPRISRYARHQFQVFIKKYINSRHSRHYQGCRSVLNFQACLVLHRMPEFILVDFLKNLGIERSKIKCHVTLQI